MALPRINRLRDVDVHAISIVTKGANGKRICLFKSDDAADDDVELASAKIVKAEDWSAFYVVVAEPGWMEQPGLYGPQDTVDVWESEDEIRKAAHRFLKNGHLINRMHEDMEPYGQLVESAVALSDIHLTGETINKGSWYIAVEPTDEGRRAIDAGEFTGVSIQGTGMRVAKVEQFTKPGTANVSPADLKRLGPLMRHYAAKPHPFRACYRDQIKHGLTPDHAKRRCAVLKDLIRGTTKWRVNKGDGGGDAPWNEEVAVTLDKIGEARGITGSEPDADTLEGMETDERKGVLRKTAEYFGLTVPDDDEIQVFSEAENGTLGSETQVTEEETLHMETEIQDRFEALEKKLDEQGESLADVKSLSENVAKLLERVEKAEEESEAPKIEDVKEAVEKLAESVEKASADIEALAAGETDQPEVDRVEKQDDSPLAGLLS